MILEMETLEKVKKNDGTDKTALYIPFQSSFSLSDWCTLTCDVTDTRGREFGVTVIN